MQKITPIISKMKIVEQKVVLKNGISVILRSPDERDAAALLLHTKITASESHFLVKTVKEAEKLTLEQERILVNAVNESRDSFIIAAFSPDGTVLASAELDAVERRAKTRHRAAFGIAVQRRVWNGGLGTLLTDMATKAARVLGYTQVELGVYADNARAIHVYQKCGFVQYGVLEKSFRLEDGSFCAEILMVKYL